MSMTEMPVATETATFARIQGLLDWRSDLVSMGYDVMSPEDVLKEIKNYPIFARSQELPEFLVKLQKEAENKAKVNEVSKKRGKDLEVFAAAGVTWLIDHEVDQLRASVS